MTSTFSGTFNPARPADHGSRRRRSFQPAPRLHVAAYYRRSGAFQPRLEYHGEFGKIGEWEDEHHYIEPTVDIGLGKQVTWHLGAGIGVSHHSDGFIAQSILTVELNVLRPSRLFGHHG